MDNLLDLYNKQVSPEVVEDTAVTPQSSNPEMQQALDDFGGPPTEEAQDTDTVNLNSNVSGNAEENEQAQNRAFSDSTMGAISSINQRDRFEDPDSWSADYSDKAFMSEAGDSIMRGVGQHFIKGTGDLLQVTAGLFNKDLISGNIVSTWLQDSGANFASKFKSYIPEELQHQNLTWSSMANPKFWSVHVAEMIPQLAESILISKGAGAGLRKLAGASLKGMKGAQAVRNTRTVANSGKGLVGKLATQDGLTSVGKGVFDAVGGGLGGNLYSGMLNAAELVNTHKNDVDANGEKIFSDEDLQDLASGTMKNNASWVFADIASWGMTFGGGWKAARKLNPLAKGTNIWNKGQQAKVVGKQFAYSMSPIIKGIGKVAGKAGAEGFEEMYQESWEEWAKQKALASKTGGDDNLWNITGDGSFYEFFNSKENEATKVLSAAVGALGGGVFNMSSLINEKADDSYRMYDRAKNLSEIIEKNGSAKENEYQEFHIRQTISDIVIDEKEDIYEEFAESLVENGNITKEEKARYDEMAKAFREVNETAKKLNVKGREALLHNNHLKTYNQSQLEVKQQIAKDNIAAVEALPGATENQKKQKIRDIENSFNTDLDAHALAIAEATQNESNLVMGIKATPLGMKTVTNKYGKDMQIGGLSEKQFTEFTKEGEGDFKAVKFGDLKETGKGVYKSVIESFKNASPKVKEAVGEVVGSFKEGVEKGKAKFTKEGEETIEEETDETVEVDNRTIFEKAKAFVQDVKLAANIKIVEGQSKLLLKKHNAKIEMVDGMPKIVVDDDTKKSNIPEAQKEFEKITEKINKIQEEEARISAQKKQEMAGKTAEKVSDENALPEVEITDEMLDSIAEKINKEEKLTASEERIRQENEADIGERIVKQVLGTDKKVSTKPNILDDLTKKNIDDIQGEHNVTIKKTEDGFDIETDLTGQEREKAIQDATDAIQDAADENINLTKDKALTDEENAFLKGEVENEIKGKSLKDANDEAQEKSKKDFKINLEHLKDASGKIGMDKRSEDVQIRDVNIAQAQFKNSMRNKIRNKHTLPEAEQISKNQLENYLNMFTTHNLLGPSAVDKMVAVNHQLKRMFPNTDNPTQVVIVKNLFESVGSQGLGMSLAGMIYIDEKAWDQGKTFMHEMSHVYFQLTKDEPHTQKLIKKTLTNAALLKDTKAKYDDYTLYKLNTPGGSRKITKREIFAHFKNSGVDLNMLNENLKKAIADGELETIPLNEQDLLIEEMFVAQLEGPLHANFDSHFNTKNEVQRQADTRMWWGLLRKKGAIIEQNNGVDTFLADLNDGPIDGNIESFIFDTFKAVTKGVTFDSYGLDHRVQQRSQEYIDAVENIAVRKKSQENNLSESKLTDLEKIEILENTDDQLEEDGEIGFDATFKTRSKSATRILRKFGAVYNKALRARFLLKTADVKTDRSKSKIKLFDKDLFESTIYNLATENPGSNDFIYNVENSEFEEIQTFNRYLDKVYPNTKLQVLNSMHFVLSNSKHIVGFRNTTNDQGVYGFNNSLSQKEIRLGDNKIDSMGYDFENRDSDPYNRWNNYYSAVQNIYAKNTTKEDIDAVLEMIMPINFKLNKVREQGYVTFKGVNVPLETLIVGFIQKGLLFNKNKKGEDIQKQVYYANARPLVEALINTNRKFSPLSAVKNAEGNMEPVRITNNHLTKEVDNIISYLSPDENGNSKTLDEFLDRYSHMSRKGLVKKGKKTYNPDGTEYVPNQFLKNIYDQIQEGVLPTISQYHGIEDISNKQGGLYKNSTSLEQGIEDFLAFVRSSTSNNGGRNKSYSANMGAFADSPRKFFMNTNRIDFSEVFTEKGAFQNDGKIINSIFQLNAKMFPGNKDAKKGEVGYDEYRAANNKAVFRNNFRKAIKDNVKFIESNQEVLSRMIIQTGIRTGEQITMSKYFNDEGKLNYKGKKLVTEQTINSIVNGYNLNEVFLPNIKGSDITKRFKMNSSPVMSVKNPNFKFEPIFFADEIVNNSVSGTDSSMYILEEDAQLLQNLGKGVFEMNHGFKILNASVEKDNPNFKGKTAYLKGYTTIVTKGHPLYNILKARKDKYNAYHLEKFGVKPSTDLSDGTFNHMAIAIPQSSDKSNFSPEQFTAKDADGNLVHTERGQIFTEAALAENIDEAMKENDKLFYDKKGGFMGIDAYNFGPQQLMDKETDEVNTPVQMINSIIVNATLNGKLKEAYEIQDLISKQKRMNLEVVVKQIESLSPADYKKLIDKGLNKKDMDQAQRILFEEAGSSIAHPYLVEIITNQLAKTLRRAGNKLTTSGTLAHQKSDTGWRAQAKENKALRGYKPRSDGGLIPAEIMLPKHMADKIKSREYITLTNDSGKGILNASKTNDKTAEEKLSALYAYAIRRARTIHGIAEFKGKEVRSHVIRIDDANGKGIGFYVKGETVIASRVPGHGPSSTGVFEVVGFDKGNGNQVSVSSEFNDITGADNDGDSLFIQTKSNKKGQGLWNKAFNKIKDYWVSPEMADQVTAIMEFEEKTEGVIKKINETFPSNSEYVMPNSPRARMKEYNNTMVSKRNVGPIFNIHKMTNILSSVNTPISRSIKVGLQEYGTFQDLEKGQNSRNQNSAILANIILDNAKHGYADALGLNEHNISQAVLMVNLGVPLEKVGLILNSPAAKIWAELNRNNSSMFHESKRKPTLLKEAYGILLKARSLQSASKGKADLSDFIQVAMTDYKSTKRPEKSTVNIEPNNIKNFSEQNNVLELLDYLADMNSEIQKLSTIMGGHKKIHVNPLVLKKQIKEFKEVLSGNIESKTLILPDDFKSNPDMQNYLDVAEETLKHLEVINPIYGRGTNNVIESLTDKIGEDLSVKQIEAISKDILKFKTSRLLGLNNKSIDYVEKLMTNGKFEKDSIFNKVDEYLKILRKNATRTGNVSNDYTQVHNSVLFTQALSLRLTGGKGQTRYISANPAFSNESLNDTERERAQKEFEELPIELQDDLILYDMIKHGWKGPMSLAPFFGQDANMIINMESNENMKDKDISPKITERLERIIALKQSRNKNNPFAKVYLYNKKTNKDINPTNESDVIKEIFKDQSIMNRIVTGEAIYINVVNTNKDKGFERELYEMERFTNEEAGQIASENSQNLKKQRAADIAKNKIKLVPYNLHKDNDIDLAMIKDENVTQPFKNFRSKSELESLDYLNKASLTYNKAMKDLRQNATGETIGLDSREDFYKETFTREEELRFLEYAQAMEFKPHVSNAIQKGMYKKYQTSKATANAEVKNGVLNGLENKTSEELLAMYNEYGKKDVYAYATIVTPVTKQLAKVLIAEQGALLKKNGVTANQKSGDISVMQSYLMAGSTIPSNHPASQGLVRKLEAEYKTFMGEKKKYTTEMNKVTDALYAQVLGYGGVSGLSVQGIKNFALRLKDALFSNRQDIYNRLYGKMVIREEAVDDKGKVTMNYKLRPVSEMEADYKSGFVSKAEKDFYDFFRKTTKELMPSSVKKTEKDYIPHTSMTRLESFSARGILGLLSNSRNVDHAMQDVKLEFNGEMKTWKTIQDNFKALASAEGKKNSASTAFQFMKLKKKATKLFKSGKNEDGSTILSSEPFVETALGFGAVNRFTNNRSVKATEMPSMDLNKALGDYIHASLFVNGNSKFQGMEKLQGYIDGVLAWNDQNNLPIMNEHIQKVWKDYFLRNKRQTSVLGETTDRVILGLTRMNLFYALGYGGLKNTGGAYAIGNVLAGKYHNIKDIGLGAWAKGESRFWGLDKGFSGGLGAINARRKRMSGIMKNMNFMDINVYDEVSMEKSGGLDRIFTDIALSPMILSEKWIQQVHMLGLLTDEQLDKFDAVGNYKPGVFEIDNQDLIRLEDQVKSSHGRGYQPTDQRAVQMYSWGNMILQFSRFIPTMIHDRFAKEDVNIYGRETIGSMTAVSKMLKYVLNNPKDFVRYRKSLSEDQRRRLDSGLKGVGMSAVIGMLGQTSNVANDLFWDANYYMNFPKLGSKMVPAPLQTTSNLVNQLF